MCAVKRSLYEGIEKELDKTNKKQKKKDRLALNDDDKKVRDWFIEETKKYGCSHKVNSLHMDLYIYSFIHCSFYMIFNSQRVLTNYLD